MDSEEEIWITDNIQIIKKSNLFDVNLHKNDITRRIATFYNPLSLILFLEKFIEYVEKEG